MPQAAAKSVVFLLVGVALFGFATQRMSDNPHQFPSADMEVVLPRFVQVVMSGGDRHLAANVAVVRSLLNSLGNDSYDHYAAQARVQIDAAWLNPRHEDNYYLATALLAWSGHISEANSILMLAAKSRPFDMQPPLYLGFNHFYFMRDPAMGAHWMYEAARRSDSEQNRISLSRIASRWAERGDNSRDALRMVEVMIHQARGLSLKRYLEARAERLRRLITVQDAARLYRERTGKPLLELDDLVRSGILKELPVDSQGLGYTLNANGEPMLRQPAIRGLEK